MDEAFNDKAEQFERLWDGITPKGINRNKSLKFRQYILEHVRQMRRPLTRDMHESIGWVSSKPKSKSETTTDSNRWGCHRLGDPLDTPRRR